MIGVACCLADSWEVTGTTEFPLKKMQPLVFEGLCTDGKNFIMNTKYSIFIMDSELNILKTTLNAIPAALLEEGYNHLGDCACDAGSGLCYCAVEEPTKLKPSIFVYNLTSSGLDFVKEHHEPIQSHMPWVALDTTTGHLYSSEYDDVCELRVYSADTLEYLHTLPITGQAAPLNGVQGGAFFEGNLYLGVNAGDSVYEIDVRTGVMELVIQQFEEGSSGEYEFEGLEFLDLRGEGKGLMHNTGNHLHPQVMFHADLTSST
jgi:hypothetical protein